MKIFTFSSAFLLSLVFFLAVDATTANIKAAKDRRRRPKAKKVRRPVKGMPELEDELEQVVLRSKQAPLFIAPAVAPIKEPAVSNKKKNIVQKPAQQKPKPVVSSGVAPVAQVQQPKSVERGELEEALARKVWELSELKRKHDDLAKTKAVLETRFNALLNLNDKLAQELAATMSRPTALRSSRQSDELQTLRIYLVGTLGMRRRISNRELIEVDKFVRERLLQLIDRLFKVLERSNQANRMMREYINSQQSSNTPLQARKMAKNKQVVVAFDCTKFPSLSKNKQQQQQVPDQKPKLPENKNSLNAQEKANAITSLNTRDLFRQVQHSIDDLRANSLVGKQRRRFLDKVAIREGTKSLEKAPRVPAKILSGMRKKAKKREVRAREETKAMGGAPSSHILTSGTIRVQKYEMRNKEASKVKDRERGLMLSHALKKRETQKPKPFRPPK